MGADPRSDLAAEIARLEASIDRAAAATEITLAHHPTAELSRQLGALRDRVARAKDHSADPGALHAELATLLFFAQTLQADADDWRAEAEQQIAALERTRLVARRERARSAAEREKLVRRRDALQSTILQTAARMAQQNRGECRRTVPVVTLGDGLTVCSVTVSYPRRWFRLGAYWLVTLSHSQDVLVRRE